MRAAGRRQQRRGATLIEVTFALILVSVLTAIAVPSFIERRIDGAAEAVSASLRDASLAQGVHRTRNGRYAAEADPSDLSDLAQLGWNESSEVQVRLAVGDADSFCMYGWNIAAADRTVTLWHTDAAPANADATLPSGAGTVPAAVNQPVRLDGWDPSVDGDPCAADTSPAGAVGIGAD